MLQDIYQKLLFYTSRYKYVLLLIFNRRYERYNKITDKYGCYYNDGYWIPEIYNSEECDEITLEVFNNIIQLRDVWDPLILCDDLTKGCVTKNLDDSECFGNDISLPSYSLYLIIILILDIIYVFMLVYYFLFNR